MFSTSQYPQWLGRRDKRGLPIYFYDFAKIDSSSVNTHKKSSAATQQSRPDSKTTPGLVSTDMLRAFLVYEHLTRFVMPFCSAITLRENPDIAVTKMLVIVDISNITVRQVWSLRGYLQDLGKIFSVNYPEVLDRVLVCTFSLNVSPSNILHSEERNGTDGSGFRLPLNRSSAHLPTSQRFSPGSSDGLTRVRWRNSILYPATPCYRHYKHTLTWRTYLDASVATSNIRTGCRSSSTPICSNC